GDLVISSGWAAALGRPALAGTLIGGFDLRLSASEPLDDPPAPPASALRGSVLDVELFELYGLGALGREGAWPNGEVGLAAATTSCNPGDVPVPWTFGSFNQLIPDHPFIGLALFRESADGILEMIGTNWIKHGFFTVDGNDCILAPSDTCYPGGGNTLGLGCADTYGINNNGSRVYLGPREEVHPLEAVWEPYGSFFDATPVDTLRNYWGSETSETAHRLVVQDADLADSNLVYKYEGVYYVKDDDDLSNNIGWEGVRIAWDPSMIRYIFTDDTPGNEMDNDGPVIATWGDQQAEHPVAADDGTVWLASQVTDLGGGQWHYEYAVYNRTSARGLRSFAVPTGFANVTNVGFHDPDADPLNDWTSSVAAGGITWETDEWAVDPAANSLDYQEMFNFRFDADAPPVASQAMAGIFRPGTGSSLLMPTQSPAFGSVSSPSVGATGGSFGLAAEPNPFRGTTRVAFQLERERSVRVSVLDVTGRAVRTLHDGRAPAGRSVIAWDGRDAAGNRTAAGIYFFRLESETESRTLKGTLLR
ncbi:MAG TPA: FlgD immunoglobulin-like domain containing protein, partial [bacterium]|nr:FlgD immunoglobulin-like domain containing protein [bacterium]